SHVRLKKKNRLKNICTYVYFEHIRIRIVSNLSEDSYDYVFGGRRKTPPATRTTTTTLKLTSPPVRLRPEDAHHRGGNVNNGGRFYRHSFSYAPKRSRHGNNSERNENRESRLRCHGEDEATLRQLLLEYVDKFTLHLLTYLHIFSFSLIFTLVICLLTYVHTYIHRYILIYLFI
ncbi:PREDICTED: uncharacterized protein LOC108378604, partial [Rhagoletis zephyria]|uniref:uncharacterized protein LOC108378604 n=1 Tax=Rhagoletis zephyria TaxID=28612 RepID=UPI000811837C